MATKFTGSQPSDAKDMKRSSFEKLVIKTETETMPDVRVVKVDAVAEPVVQQFHFGRISRPNEGNYAAIKAKYGALASTDAERAGRNQKDRRFALSELLRDPLSVDEEERRVIGERVRERVNELAEEAKVGGQAEGYKAGLKQGYDEAFDKFREEASERLARFEEFLGEAESCKDEIFRNNERFLMEIVCRMARMVTLKELSTDQEYILRLSRELVERMGVRENVRIRIHPEEIHTIGLLKEGLEKTLGTMKNLTIEASNQVKRGGCTVETEWNAIDASLETQFQGVREALIGPAAILNPGGASGGSEAGS